MADVINKTTGEYRKSVHTPDYPEKDWLINPDLKQVSGLDPSLWVVVGDAVLPMPEEQRVAKAQAAEEAAKLAEVNSAKEQASGPLVKSLAYVIAEELTLIRKQAGLSDRTNEEIVQAIMTALEGL
jgi:hypothetical protein